MLTWKEDLAFDSEYKFVWLFSNFPEMGCRKYFDRELDVLFQILKLQL